LGSASTELDHSSSSSSDKKIKGKTEHGQLFLKGESRNTVGLTHSQRFRLALEGEETAEEE
jgi:hypothetical protein